MAGAISPMLHRRGMQCSAGSKSVLSFDCSLAPTSAARCALLRLAAKTTPFTGLSRFNSLVPSLTQTPLATFRQHPAFAPGLQQPNQQAHPALLAGQHAHPSSGWAGAWHAGGAAAQSQQRSGRRHGSTAAVGGEGRRRSGEGADGAEGQEEEDTSPSTSGSPVSPMAVVAGLGISVSSLLAFLAPCACPS